MVFEVKYTEKGRENDFKRIDRERYIIVRDWFKSGSLYYFRVNEFNFAVVAEEDIIYIAEL